jgi:hypothetical protein
MIKLIQVRQEGTLSTGRLLFVDLINSETGEETCWELDIETGEVIEGAKDIDGDVFSLDREPTTEELAVINGGFSDFKKNGLRAPRVC